EVLETPVQVDTTTSTFKEVVDHSRIVELPLNGRDAARLASLVPGTAVVSVSTETGKSIPGGLRLSSNGAQGRQVAFRLDGVSNTDFYFQENQTFPFPDALQEFSIQSSNYSAAYGNNAVQLSMSSRGLEQTNFMEVSSSSSAIVFSTPGTFSHQSVTSSRGTSSAHSWVDQ